MFILFADRNSFMLEWNWVNCIYKMICKEKIRIRVLKGLKAYCRHPPILLSIRYQECSFNLIPSDVNKRSLWYQERLHCDKKNSRIYYPIYFKNAFN